MLQPPTQIFMHGIKGLREELMEVHGQSVDIGFEVAQQDGGTGARMSSAHVAPRTRSAKAGDATDRGH